MSFPCAGRCVQKAPQDGKLKKGQNQHMSSWILNVVVFKIGIKVLSQDIKHPHYSDLYLGLQPFRRLTKHLSFFLCSCFH